MSSKQTKENNELNKEIEKKFETNISWKYFIVRLDWKSFSKFTKKFFQKPYDKNLDEIMQNVTESLLKTFNAFFWYTQSDEITLVFFWEKDKMFNWRVQKTVSLLSWKTSSLFMLELLKKWYTEAMNSTPFFDARIFATDDFNEVVKSLEFRYFDCLRNSKLNLSMFLSKKDRLYKCWMDVVKLTKDKLDYFSLPLSYRKWTFFKKDTVEKDNPMNEWEKILRTEVKRINVENFPKENFTEYFNIIF